MLAGPPSWDSLRVDARCYESNRRRSGRESVRPLRLSRTLDGRLLLRFRREPGGDPQPGGRCDLFVREVGEGIELEEVLRDRESEDAAHDERSLNLGVAPADPSRQGLPPETRAVMRSMLTSPEATASIKSYLDPHR